MPNNTLRSWKQRRNQLVVQYPNDFLYAMDTQAWEGRGTDRHTALVHISEESLPGSSKSFHEWRGTWEFSDDVDIGDVTVEFTLRTREHESNGYTYRIEPKGTSYFWPSNDYGKRQPMTRPAEPSRILIGPS